MKEFIEKLIKELEAGIFSKDEIRNYNSSTQENMICQNKGIKYAIRKVNELAEEHNGGWIPCSKRLLEKFDSVLVSCEGSVVGSVHEGEKCEFVATGYMFSKDHWQIQGHNDVKYIKVIAWQPLPSKYTGGRKNE